MFEGEVQAARAYVTSLGLYEVELNGEPIFCRGTCWTPVDAIRLGASRESLREALVEARDAGMNMLRVAGTTVYE